jgi:hypothetical protein
MMLFMRTTVTLEDDVERLIREKMHRSRKSFKKTLNDAIRQGLLSETSDAKRTKFVVKAHSMGNRPGIDPATLSDLDTDIEVERYHEVTDKLMREMK